MVTEAMHEGGAQTVSDLLKTAAEELTAHWPTTTASAVLTRSAPEFVFGD